MKIQSILIYLLYFYCSNPIWAQQPSFRGIGADFFAETDIYSLLEDKAQNIWMTTDKGLFRYDGDQFIKLSNKQLKGNSLFDLTADLNGQLYCLNLHGQIFKVVDDSLHLYYEVPDSLLGNMLNLDFDNKNQMTISSKHFFVVDTNLRARIVHDCTSSRSIMVNKPAKNKEGALLSFLGPQNRIGYFVNNEFKVQESPFVPDLLEGERYTLLANSSHEVAVLVSGSKVFKKKNATWVEIKQDLRPNINSNCILSKTNQLWFLTIDKGAYLFDLDGKKLLGGKKIFPSYYISSFMEDAAGNIWLGTFKKGLLFIPNLDVVDFTEHSLLKGEDLKCLTKGEDGSVYLGSHSGSIFGVNSFLEMNLITDQYTIPIDKMSFFQAQKKLFFNSCWLDLKDEKSANTAKIVDNVIYSTIKNIQKIRADEILLATNVGIFYMNIGDKKSPEAKVLESILNKEIKHEELIVPCGRTKCLYYQEDELWVGRTVGLQLLKKNAKIDLKYKNKRIVSTSITGSGTQVYVGTKDGILVFENGQLQKAVTTKDGLLSNSIQKIKYNNGYLFIANEKGFQRLHLDSETYSNFEKSDGLLGNFMLDFIVDKDLIWLLTKKGLQLFRFSELSEVKIKPVLSFVNIKVNEEKVDHTLFGNFTFEQKKVEFEFIAKFHRDKNGLTYFYKVHTG